ncbi:pentapeptide repeat-containing protein [Streptomyces bacillaris]|uniref:pentapeptide repeat-containing protein n=1 Tax=Streptomyces bacillaris TaxID=68179 RepID=UPI0036FD7711
MLVLSFVTAVLVAVAVFYTGWGLLGARELKPEHRIDSKTLFDLVKLSFGVVAGAGALVALVVAYRRQRVDENGALREATRLHTERFTTAVGQLGHESAAVRLGGVHALAGLADDAPTRALRQTCIDVLCSYLRLPYTAEADLPAGDSEARNTYLSLREVRHTIIRLVRDHLRFGPDQPHSWHGHDFDFTGVIFDGGDFSKATFSDGTVDFGGAVFSGGTVSFRDARFSGSTVSFDGAQFSGSTVLFTRARFSDGDIRFVAAVFSDGSVRFDDARFSGGTVRFYHARFSGGTLGFEQAAFSGGAVNFQNVQFSGGAVRFTRAQLSGGTVDFQGAVFSSGTVDFVNAVFSGSSVSIAGASFSGGTVLFLHAQFVGGAIRFNGAELSGGLISFARAQFAGGTVDFSGATGTVPAGLVSASGSPPPTGVILSPTW